MMSSPSSVGAMNSRGCRSCPGVSASVHYSPDFYLEAGDPVYVDGTVGMSLKGVLGGELPGDRLVHTITECAAQLFDRPPLNPLPLGGEGVSTVQ